MKGPGGRSVGPSLDWLRETREKAEGKLPKKQEENASWNASWNDNDSWKDGKSWGDESGGWQAGGWASEGGASWKQAKSWGDEDTNRDRGGRQDGRNKSNGKGNENSFRNLIKGDAQGDENSSRNLLASSRTRNRSASASSSSSRPKRTRRKGLWDSTVEAPEVKPSAAAAPKKKRDGLVIEAGAKVDIHGLVGAAQYNGCEGKVIAGPNEKGRWKVEVLFEGCLKEMALQPGNLEPKPTCGWEVVVAGLREISSEQDVAAAFAQFGRVVSCKVTRDLNGQSKGVALVVMASKESAENALMFNSDIRVSGIPTTLQWSTMVKQQMGLLKNRDEESGKTETSSRKFQEQPTPNPTSQPRPFSIGQSVVIAGLKGAPQYNGTVATVQSFRQDGRCEVSLQADGEMKTLALKVENLSAASGSTVGSDTVGNATESNQEARGEASGRRRFKEGPELTSDSSAAKLAQVETSTASTTGDAADARRRRSRWEEGQADGEVYVRTGMSQNHESGGAAASEKDCFPDEASLNEMTAKELRKLLVDRNISISGCFEKAEFLERALSAR